MPIPKEILSVPRPKNTVVTVYGVNKDRFAVRQRVGCIRKNGKNYPVNGPTVGHIVNGTYVPKPTKERCKVQHADVDIKDWGNIIECDQVAHSLLNDLRNVYNEIDAQTIYCICILRVCYPGIKDYELKEAYDNSYLSELFPNIPISKNFVSKFTKDIGKSCSRIFKFMENRIKNVKIDHHLIVDGTIKTNESDVNSLSNFSYKSRLKGTRSISIIYAFDLENMEPVCSQCFPGNMIDATSYEYFLSSNKIKKGIIVADKGFPSSCAKKYFKNNPNLHYLNPIKRNSKNIEKLSLYNYEGILKEDKNITFCKRFDNKSKKWFYSFRDTTRAMKEEQEYLIKNDKFGTFDDASFKEKQKIFGTIILESDMELDPEVAYKTYEDRWRIELVFRFYKSALEFETTRVHNDFSVIGTEFFDFISTIITCMLLKKFSECKLLEKMTYKKIMKLLVRSKQIKLNGIDWKLIKLNPSQESILQQLGLLDLDGVPLVVKRAEFLCK